ncbi:MAG: hypothetical protein J3R72DRAFT_450558 [Linnemannia gamsii]|nr:MAG: hypothetical protein J3R72DRAFT_450558 [Linnemannia gamsii]
MSRFLIFLVVLLLSSSSITWRLGCLLGGVLAMLRVLNAVETLYSHLSLVVNCIDCRFFVGLFLLSLVFRIGNLVRILEELGCVVLTGNTG